jgi:phage protein D
VFNYVSVSFPLSQNPPQRISSFTLRQERYAHETIKVRFRDWGIRYTSVKPGDPVKCVLRGKNNSREWVGYVHEIRPNITPGANFTEVTFIGASYRLKQAKQRVFEKMTASNIVRQIANEYGFTARVEDHPRVYDQVVQAGHTELQLMSRLAKQCGYSLRVENTSIYFHSLTSDFTNNRDAALRFKMSDSNSPTGSTLYSFNLILGESTAYKDSYKSAVQVGGVDPVGHNYSLVTNERLNTLNESSATEFFDSFATNVVAPGFQVAAYEAKAADERNRFPYRARIQIIGTPEIKPDQPIYLEGIGSNYSGYWIVLYTEHSVVEQSPNILKYTTILDVGADSIGQAEVWKGENITSPSDVRVRTLVPDTRNVPPNNSSVLTEGTGTYNNSGFTEVSNRATTSNVRPHVWVAANVSDSVNNIDVRNRPEAIVRRLAARGVL